MTALVALAALVYTSESLRATRDQLRINEQAQISDRYSKAIEQLGSGTVDVRLGAVYALERVMRDSPGDQPVMVEVLASFVRVHASTSAFPPRTESTQAGGGHLSADVQAALTVLGRRDPNHDGTTRIDLQRTDLAGADLGGAQLAGAYLSLTNLRQAYLRDADLRGAWMRKADLRDADLAGANLRETHMDDAKLGNAYLAGTDIGGADLGTAQGLSSDQLKCVRYIDSATRLPQGTAPPAIPGQGCPQR